MSKFLLKGLIITKGFTIKGFAEATGIEYQRLKRILSGSANIYLDEIIKMCRVLKMSPLIFFPVDVQNIHQEFSLLNNLQQEEEAING